MKKIYVTSNKNYKAHRAFTLLELILVLVLISIIAGYAIRQIEQISFRDDVERLQDTIYNIITTGVINNETGGYASGLGGTDCSENLNVQGLTTQKLWKCKGWNDRLRDEVGLTTRRYDLVQTTGVGSDYFLSGKGLLDAYPKYLPSIRLNESASITTFHASGCIMSVRQASDVTGPLLNEFDVFVDCETTNLSERRIDLIENSVKFVFNDRLNELTKIIYENAIDNTTTLANSTSGAGDEKDGKIRARLKIW